MTRIQGIFLLLFAILPPAAKAGDPQSLVLARGVSRLIRLPFDMGAFQVSSPVDALKLGFRKIQRKDGKVNAVFFLPKHDGAITLRLFDKEGKIRREYAVSVAAPSPEVIERQKAEEKKDGIEVYDLDLSGVRVIDTAFDIGSVFLTDPNLVAFDRVGTPNQPTRKVQLIAVKDGMTDFSISDPTHDRLVKYYIRVRGN